MDYYFVLSALPPLKLKGPTEMSFKELKDFLRLNLTSSDFQQVLILLRPIDLYNIRAFWLGHSLDEKGNLSAKELEEALLVRDDLPQFVLDFLDRHETTAERLRYFPSLYASLFRETEDLIQGFLKQYHHFERERMLILTALRAKSAGRDIVRELQFEEIDDPFVSYILAQKDASDFTPPKEYEDLKILFVEKGHDPEKLNRALLEYQLGKIEAMEEEESPFSIDRILGYVARFLIVDSYLHLDREKGRMQAEQLSKYD